MSEAGAIRMGFDKDGCDILLSFAKNQKKSTTNQNRYTKTPP